MKDDIEKVKTGINKESALLRRQNLISKQELKCLKQITPITPIARPTLKTQKSIKSEIDHQNNWFGFLQNINVTQ